MGTAACAGPRASRRAHAEGGSIKAGHEEHEALEDEDIDQEQIVKEKKG